MTHQISFLWGRGIKYGANQGATYPGTETIEINLSQLNKSRLLQMQLFPLVTNALVGTGAVGQGPGWGLLALLVRTARVWERQRPRGHE